MKLANRRPLCFYGKVRFRTEMAADCDSPAKMLSWSYAFTTRANITG